jgi:hypothetical protein
MKIDLLTLTRQKYSQRHPERDTRQMPVDDTLLAALEAVEEQLERLRTRQERLEAKLNARDAE